MRSDTQRTPTDRAADSDRGYQLSVERSDGAVGRELLHRYAEEIASLYPGWTLDTGPSAAADELVPPHGCFVVAFRAGQPRGCGALKRLDSDAAEVKRLYAAPEDRGRGLARLILERLERAAVEGGYGAIRLDTGDRQPHALALFLSAGYREIDDYNANPCARHWLEKRLVAARA